jgi:hypothetical protein
LLALLALLALLPFQATTTSSLEASVLVEESFAFELQLVSVDKVTSETALAARSLRAERRFNLFIWVSLRRLGWIPSAYGDHYDERCSPTGSRILEIGQKRETAARKAAESTRSGKSV